MTVILFQIPICLANIHNRLTNLKQKRKISEFQVNCQPQILTTAMGHIGIKLIAKSSGFGQETPEGNSSN